MEGVQFIIFVIPFGAVGQQLRGKRVYDPSTQIIDFQFEWEHHHNQPIDFVDVLAWLEHHNLLN